MSKKPKTTEEAFTPEQLEKLTRKGERDVQMQRQKEGLFQRYTARRDAVDIAKQVRWKRRAGVALVILVAVLLLLYLISWLLTTIGDLVISVDSAAVKKGITISASADGSDPQTILSANMVGEVTNITYDWLPATLDLEADGSHNGRNYLAYTFYLNNNGKETLDYVSTLKSVRSAKSADEACRVMIYKNGEPTVYAKKNLTDINGNLPGKEGADPMPFETIYKKVIPANYTAPSAEEIKAAAEEPQNKDAVEVTDEELTIVEFVDDEIVFNLEGKGLEPGQTDKYTIVMWIEGEDPECIDDIRGGYVKLNWFINIKDEEL